jgi:hypothetical protein
MREAAGPLRLALSPRGSLRAFDSVRFAAESNGQTPLRGITGVRPLYAATQGIESGHHRGQTPMAIFAYLVLRSASLGQWMLRVWRSRDVARHLLHQYVWRTEL